MRCNCRPRPPRRLPVGARTSNGTTRSMVCTSPPSALAGGVLVCGCRRRARCRTMAAGHRTLPASGAVFALLQPAPLARSTPCTNPTPRRGRFHHHPDRCLPAVPPMACSPWRSNDHTLLDHLCAAGSANGPHPLPAVVQPAAGSASGHLLSGAATIATAKAVAAGRTVTTPLRDFSTIKSRQSKTVFRRSGHCAV